MVLILGCGYVGTYTAKLLQGYYPLTVTTRSQERLTSLPQDVKSVLLDTSNVEMLHRLLLDEDILIITIAAKNTLEYQQAYLDTACNLKKALTGIRSVKQIIYTSSTSVYGDAQGKVVTEESPTLALSEQGRILIETERTLLSLKSENRNVVILRLAEIYGPSRTLLQKVERLRGKKAPGDGSQIAHLIHVEDIARAILFAITHHLDGVYNLCDHHRISRKELYDRISHRYHLPRVEWDPQLRSIHRTGFKIVSNQKITNLGFTLLH